MKKRGNSAMRMRTMLLLPLLSIPILFTSVSLLVLRRNMQQEMHEALGRDLQHSAATYRNLENERRIMLGREAALLSAQPSLKALMTTQDSRTIQDQGGDYARLSGADLLAMISPAGKVVALYDDRTSLGNGSSKSDVARARIITLLQERPAISYIFDGDRLFEVAMQPLYFGSPETGALLGYVVAGSIIDHDVAHQVSQAAAAEIAFSVGEKVISSTLEPTGQQALQVQLTRWTTAVPIRKTPTLRLMSSSAPGVFEIDGRQYLTDHIELTSDGEPPVGLIVLRSMEELRVSQRRLNRSVIGLGLSAFLLGGLLAFLIARRLTSPLEGLAVAVAAVGAGNYEVALPSSGAVEVRNLSASIENMRQKIHETQAELVEAERLAMIGQMASSVSHDLRHYLASVYANAEFLASTPLTGAERLDLLSEIQLSVQGTTDLIDSLLLFTQTGRALQLALESVTYLAERVIMLVSKHPEAANVNVTLLASGTAEAWVDAKKIERAIYNLVLNACQAARRGATPATVHVDLTEEQNAVNIRVSDSGPGVPEAIRTSLFEPFVSAEKQNGMGIGLTLSATIAEEHGGSVRLETTQPGRTVFVFTLRRDVAATQPSKTETGQSARHGPLKGGKS